MNNIITNYKDKNFFVGAIFINNQGCKGEILGKVINKSNYFYIRFIKTKKTIIASRRNIKNGSFKDYFNPVVYGVGYLGEFKNGIKKNGKHIKSYSIWRSMLGRSYGNLYKSYENCKVCTEWHNFNNFKKWFDFNYIEGFELDKDLLGNGKLYSPENCCFLPHSINSFMVLNKGQSKLKLGVYKSKGHQYESRINNQGEPIYLGGFYTEEEAYRAWLQAKKNIAIELANKYKGIISEKSYNFLVLKDIRQILNLKEE